MQLVCTGLTLYNTFSLHYSRWSVLFFSKFSYFSLLLVLCCDSIGSVLSHEDLLYVDISCCSVAENVENKPYVSHLTALCLLWFVSDSGRMNLNTTICHQGYNCHIPIVALPRINPGYSSACSMFSFVVFLSQFNPYFFLVFWKITLVKQSMLPVTTFQRSNTYISFLFHFQVVQCLPLVDSQESKIWGIAVWSRFAALCSPQLSRVIDSVSSVFV